MRRSVETSHLFKIRANDIVPERTEQMVKVRLEGETTHVHNYQKLKSNHFQASATKGEGLDESMEWLSNTLHNKK